MRHVILDVETIKSFDEVGGYFPGKLGVSFVGVIEREGLPARWGEKVKEERYKIFEKDMESGNVPEMGMGSIDDIQIERVPTKLYLVK